MGTTAGVARGEGADTEPKRSDTRGADRTPAALWVVALLTAALGAATAYAARPGINYGLWTTFAGGGLWWMGRRRSRGDGTRGIAPTARYMIVLACLVTWASAITADDAMQFFIVVAAIVLLATASRVLGGLPGTSVDARVLATAPPVAFGRTTVEAGRRLLALVTDARSARQAALVRGIMVAIPVAGLFALILAGADPTLATWRHAVWQTLTAVDLIPRSAFFLGLGTITVGAYGLALRPAAASPPVPPRAVGPMGATERHVIVGSVAAVFGVFLLVQTTEMFRDTSALRISGMTYAEYAHEGFVELTIAATLAVVLVLALDRYVQRSDGWYRSPAWRRHWGTLVLIAEVIVVLVSAYHRLALYEAAYGYTLLRLHVGVYLVGVGVTLGLLALEVVGASGAFDGPRVVRRSGFVAVVLLAALSFSNPDAWVVRHNLDRMRATGKVDVNYLATLSLNAAPALVDAIGSLPPACDALLRRNLYNWMVEPNASTRDDRWYEWNLRREAGVRALRRAHIPPPPPAAPPAAGQTPQLCRG